MLETSTRDHYIDVATRRFTLESLEKNLRRDRAMFLDTGCSTGWLLDDTRRRFPNASITGADVFLPGLQKIRRRNPDARVVQFDLCGAPFKNQSFDAIACLEVLEHIEDDTQALKEIRRMLKSDGSAFLMVPAGPEIYDYYDEVLYHVRRYDKVEFRDKILEAGLVIHRLCYMGIFLYPAFYLVKKYGRWKMRDKTFEEKKQRVMKDVRLTGGAALASASLLLEWRLGPLMPQPFGIRLCAHVSRA